MTQRHVGTDLCIRIDHHTGADRCSTADGDRRRHRCVCRYGHCGRNAGIAKTITIGIRLQCVRQGRAVINPVGDIVTVDIRIADVPCCITVQIRLIIVRIKSAVIVGIQYPIAIRIVDINAPFMGENIR